MSYSIEYNRELYRNDSAKGPDLVLLVKTGDNNVYSFEGYRVRNWHVSFQGGIKEFWPHIGETAGYCDGGGLQRANGWRTTKYVSVEEYVALYRKVFRRRKPIEDMFGHFRISLDIKLRGTKEIRPTIDDIENTDKRAALAAFLARKNIPLKPAEAYWGELMAQANIEIQTLDDFLECLQFKGWHNMKQNNSVADIRLDFTERNGGRR